MLRNVLLVRFNMSNWFNQLAPAAPPITGFGTPQRSNSIQASTNNNVFGTPGNNTPGAGQSQLGGAQRESIPQSDLAESQSLQKKYLESFTPGSKKKSSAVSSL